MYILTDWIWCKTLPRSFPCALILSHHPDLVTLDLEDCEDETKAHGHGLTEKLPSIGERLGSETCQDEQSTRRVWQAWVKGTVFNTVVRRLKKKTPCSDENSILFTTRATFQGTAMTHVCFFCMSSSPAGFLPCALWTDELDNSSTICPNLVVYWCKETQLENYAQECDAKQPAMK